MTIPTAARAPKVFIGAAAERDDLVGAVKRVLEELPGAVIARSWRDAGVDGDPGKTTIEILTQAVKEYDFGVFLLSPDDITVLRGQEGATTRDNVILEFGLFLGALGRDRTFAFTADTFATSIPSDLAGVALYKWNSADAGENPGSAIRADAQRLREVVLKTGPLVTPAAAYDFRGVPGVTSQPSIGDGWVEAARAGRLTVARLQELGARRPRDPLAVWAGCRTRARSGRRRWPRDGPIRSNSSSGPQRETLVPGPVPIDQFGQRILHDTGCEPVDSRHSNRAD